MPPLSSPSVRFPFGPLASGSGYSASCSSFQPSIGSASQWLSQRPDLRFRVRQIFPFHPSSFRFLSFRFCLFSFLFVSFRPSLFRSHSRSTGAHVQSASFPSLPFRVFSCRPLPFVRVRFRARLLSLCFFFSLLHVLPSQWFPHCRFRSRFCFRLAPSVSVSRSRLSSVPPACFHAFFPDSVLSFAAIPFNCTVRLTAASFCA